MKTPPIPNNIGKRRRITNIRGKHIYLVIEDEITRIQSDAPNKVISFQRIRFEKTGKIEYRLGYYMIGVKPGARGRWVWGQYALLIPTSDMKALIKQARIRKWI